MAIDLCGCLDAGARFDQFATKALGDDELFGESELWTCKGCGRAWLHYLLELESVKGAGRWYRGQLAPGTAVDPKKAAAFFAAMPGYLAGGSYFGGLAHRRSGPLDRDSYLGSPPFRRTDFRPSEEPEGAAGLAISDDLRWLGFVRTDKHPTFCIEGLTPRTEEVDHGEEHSRALTELSWNASGAYLASIQEIGTTPARRMLSWRDPAFENHAGWFDVHSYAWMPDGKALVAADFGDRKIRRFAADPGSAEPVDIADLKDDGDPLLAPWIAPSPDGRRVAYTSRRVADQVTEILLDGAVLTQIPGSAVQPAPFWSADGRSLGVHLVHLEQEKSAILIVPNLEGGGELLYASELIDQPGPGAWSPSGRSIAFFRTKTPKHEFTKTGEPQLVILDVASGELWPLTQPGQASGRPRFLDDRRLLVDGGRSAHLFEFSAPL